MAYTIPTRNVRTIDSYPAPGITVRTSFEDGEFLRHALFVGGWRVGEYKTDGGLLRAITREADRDGVSVYPSWSVEDAHWHLANVGGVARPYTGA